jgi:hypothetical protein
VQIVGEATKTKSHRIGLIGGCINNQPGMPEKDLYHKVLRDLLQVNAGQVDYQVSLATYLTYDKVFEKTRDFIINNDLIEVYVFIRNFPLMPLCKPIIRYQIAEGKVKWAWHPNIYKRKMSWRPGMSSFQGVNPFVYKPRRRFGLRDLNLLAGQSLGLKNWALKYIRTQFEMIRDFCEKNSVRLIIIAPQKSPTSIMGNLMCKWVTEDLEKFCAEKQLKFINIFEYTLKYFENDNTHLNAEAHKLLGRTIYNDLKANEYISKHADADYLRRSN